jgi:hypothetical protein
MISSRYTLGGLAVVVASSFIPMSSAHANGCEWKNGVTGPIPYSIDLGTHYVPRDVPRSTPIGPIDAFFIRNGQGRSIDCYTLGPQIDFKSRNNLPLVPGNFIISGEDSTGKIIKTNVDGVGVRVKLGPPYTTGWTPVGSSVAVVPYEAYVARYLPFGLIHSLLQPNITLVKTGDIAPGIHLLNVSNLLEGWFTGVGTGFNLSLTGTVIQAECSVSANPVSADPVDLGAWNLSDFTAIGDKTTAEPFTITLNSCMTDVRLLQGPGAYFPYAIGEFFPVPRDFIADFRCIVVRKGRQHLILVFRLGEIKGINFFWRGADFRGENQLTGSVEQRLLLIDGNRKGVRSGRSVLEVGHDETDLMLALGQLVRGNLNEMIVGLHGQGPGSGADDIGFIIIQKNVYSLVPLMIIWHVIPRFQFDP